MSEIARTDDPGLPIPDADLPEGEALDVAPATDTVKVPAEGDPEPADPGDDPAGTPAPEEVPE